MSHDYRDKSKNCYAFEDDITFSMKADMRNKKFGANVHKENNFNVLKTVGIYGPNNVGKTCLIKCIRAIRNVLLNKKNGLMPNIFTESDVCELGVTFMADIEKMFESAINAEGIEGIIINPWNRTIMLDKELIRIVLG